MEDIPLNSKVYVVGRGGSANEVEFELNKVRGDIKCIRIVLDNEYVSSEEGIKESEFLKLKEEVLVVVTLGDPHLRNLIYTRYKQNVNVKFPNIIFCDSRGVSELGKGNIIMPDVRLNCNITIGDFNYLNYGSFIAHDVSLQDYNTLSPFSVVSGNCQLMDSNFLGSGSILNPNVILNSSTVSSGTVVRAGYYSSSIIAQDFAKKYEKR